MRVTKPILHLCQKIGIAIFLYLDDTLLLANSFTQAKKDGQMVVQLLQKLGFVLSLEKCQLEPTQEFTHLGLVFNTHNMTVTSPVQGPNNKGTDSQSGFLLYMQRGDEALGLTYFASMALALSRLHSLLFQYWLKENSKTPADLFKGLKPDP